MADDSPTPYVEWRNEQCIVLPASLRSNCTNPKYTDLGVTYNYDTQSCNITDEFCKRYGLQFVGNDVGNDCNLPIGQQIAEFLFGETVCRGLIQVFDPNQYNSCADEDGDDASEFIKAMTILGAAIVTIGAIAITIATAGAAAEAFVGAAAVIGEAIGVATATATTVAVETAVVAGVVAGTEVAVAGAVAGAVIGTEVAVAGAVIGTEVAVETVVLGTVETLLNAAVDATLDYAVAHPLIVGVGAVGGATMGHFASSQFCQKKCDPGYHKVAGVCWLNSPTYYRGGPSMPRKRGCPDGTRDDGTSCWDDWSCSTSCDWDWDWSDGGFCHTSCSGCGCIKQNLFDRQTCDGGDYEAGLCYASCDPGYRGEAFLCWDNRLLSYVPDYFHTSRNTPFGTKNN